MNNWTLGSKLTIGIAIIIVLMGILGYVSWTGVHHLDRYSEILEYVNDIDQRIITARWKINQTIGSTSQEEHDGFVKAYNEAVDGIPHLCDEASALLNDPEDKQRLHDISEMKDPYRATANGVFEHLTNIRRYQIAIDGPGTSLLAYAKSKGTNALLAAQEVRLMEKNFIIFTKPQDNSIDRSRLDEQFTTHWKSEWKKAYDRFVAIAGTGASAATQDYVRVFNDLANSMEGYEKDRPNLRPHSTAFNNAISEAYEDASASMKKTKEDTNRQIMLMIILGVALSALVGIVIRVMLARQINHTGNQINEIVQDVVQGRLDSRGDVDSAGADFKQIVSGINQMIDAFVAPINVTAEYVDRISKGNIPPKITETYRGDFNEIKNNLNACIDVMSGLLNDTNQLIEATRKGQLDKRGDVSGYQNGWRELVTGINQLIDAFVGPITVTAEYVDRISKGNMPPKITDDYQGDFNEIKNNLNQCIDTITSLLTDVNALVEAAVAGRLNERANAGQHQGDFRKLVEGVNLTISSIVGLIDTVPSPFMIIDKEFNIQYMNKTGADVLAKSQHDLVGQKCYDNFKTRDCKTEGCALHKAMRSGRIEQSETHACPNGLDLEIRYDGAPIRNREGEIVGALEVVTDQTAIKKQQLLASKIADYQNGEVQNLVKRLGLLSKGDLGFETGVASTDADTEATGESFMAINNGLEGVKSALNKLTQDARYLVKEALDGHLKSRADAQKHAGEYANIIAGVNELLDAIMTPMNEAMSVMERLANKDMSARVNGNYKGDLNVFKQNINNAADNLDNALIQVNNSVEQFIGAADQISSGSQALAEGTSEQASSLEEVASSLEEMNSLTVGNADNARQGASLSQQALGNVEKGNQAMTQMNEAMTSISKSAEETGKIIKTIDEIAFQTNLLALNAAVEAAHAGEAGKGFAVVAEEVKNLALRSAEAAKNTSELIEGSLKNSEAGTKIVQQVSASFEEIRGSFEKVNSIVNEISAASDEQAEGIGQVNSAIAELNHLTQRNAANAEESASAAEELNSQSNELGSMVAEFKLTTRSHSAKGGRQGADRRRGIRQIGYNGDKNMLEVTPERVLPLDEVDGEDFEDFGS